MGLNRSEDATAKDLKCNVNSNDGDEMTEMLAGTKEQMISSWVQIQTDARA